MTAGYKNGRKGEQIRGGFFVFRRGKKTGRISKGASLPFEHPSFEAAQSEAQRLCDQFPGERFAVFGQMAEFGADMGGK